MRPARRSQCRGHGDRVDTKATRAGQTNADGRFLFSQVNPGTYTVTVRARALRSRRRSPVAVDVGRTVTLNFTLAVVLGIANRGGDGAAGAADPGESKHHHHA